MKRFALSMITIVACCSMVISACNSQQEAKAQTSDAKVSNNDMVKRGEYLVTIMGCDDCHSPKKFGPNGPEPDMENRLSGHPANMPLGKINTEELKSWVLFNPTTTAFVGPWGVSYSANISSDNTGIGSWTEQQFFKAMREGKYKGLDNARPILPPMPWPSFSKTTDEDLKAIFSYLKSTKPINNVVPDPVGPDRVALLK
jgi:hypothetical protein